jgi:hypothetical protein
MARRITHDTGYNEAGTTAHQRLAISSTRDSAER